MADTDVKIQDKGMLVTLADGDKVFISDDASVSSNSPDKQKQITFGNLRTQILASQYLDRYEILPVAWFLDGSVPPADVDVSNEQIARKFSGTIDEDVTGAWYLPPDLLNSSTKFRVHFQISEVAGPSAETVYFTLGVYQVGTDVLISTPTSITTALTEVQNTAVVSGWSSGFSTTNTSADNVYFKLIRTATHGSDTYAQDIAVTAVELTYTVTT